MGDRFLGGKLGGKFVGPNMIESELTLASMVRKQDSNQEDMTMMESSNKRELEAATNIAQEKTLELMLSNGANYKQYTKVRNQLANQFTQDVDNNPKTIKNAIRLLNNYNPLKSVQMFTGHQKEEEVAFVQQDEQEDQKLSGVEKLLEKAKEAKFTKAVAEIRRRRN